MSSPTHTPPKESERSGVEGSKDPKNPTPPFIVALNSFPQTEVSALKAALDSADGPAIIHAVDNTICFFQSVFDRLEYLNIPSGSDDPDDCAAVLVEIVCDGLDNLIKVVNRVKDTDGLSGSDVASAINEVCIPYFFIVQTLYIKAVTTQAEPFERELPAGAPKFVKLKLKAVPTSKEVSK